MHYRQLRSNPRLVEVAVVGTSANPTSVDHLCPLELAEEVEGPNLAKSELNQERDRAPPLIGQSQVANVEN